MATLTEGQYEIDGYVFGLGTPVRVLKAGDVHTGASVRDQDVDHPQADTVLFGRDRLTGPRRELTVIIEATDATAELEKLRQAWRADSKRTTPLAVSTLRWMRHGYTFRAYGRPRGFEPLHRDPVEAGRRFAQMDFRYRDAIVYADEADSITLDLVAGPLTDGLLLPAVLPWTLGRVTRARDGVMTVTGRAAVPFTVSLHGPSSGSATDLLLYGPGWRLDFGDLALPAGQTITVDTAGVGSAKIGATSVAGYLTRTSTLTGKLSPGMTEFRFSAIDSSATTTATITWRPAALII